MKNAFLPKSLLTLTAVFCFSIYSFSQESESSDKCWYHWDHAKLGVAGISLKETYDFLREKNRKSKTVIVAIIDSGADTAHIDLKDNLWTNPGEIPYNGIDDDKNGYVDDIHGWNFIGGSSGENVNGDSWEKTRYYGRLKAKFGEKTKKEISKEDAKDWALWEEVKTDYENELLQTAQELSYIQQLLKGFEAIEDVLTDFFDSSEFTLDQVKEINSTDEKVLEAKRLYVSLTEGGLSKKDLQKWFDDYNSTLQVKLNPDNNTRLIVGDDVTNIKDSLYGNNDVKAETSSHGTSVSGIVGAVRGNGEGIDGIADNVKLMIIRVVPGGDERDKDVALGIRYAVKMGAQIINCSFGKDYSPNKEFVDDAARFAEKNNVLIVHAAGNDSKDIDEGKNFPTAKYLDGNSCSTWLEVGASSQEVGIGLNADFSNYGKVSVDLFAPGVDIYTLNPGNAYGSSDGTSVASPVAAGVAALILSYYPNLTAVQLKKILMDSSVKYSKQQTVVYTGNGKTKKKKFGDLSKTGGIVNALNAAKMAEELMKK